MSEATCLVCGGTYRPSNLPGLLQCGSCGFITANVTLSGEDLAKLYTANYFSGEEYKDYLAERELIEKHFRIRLNRLLQHVREPASKRLLEIGSAYGFFLAVAQNRFASVAGIDISQDAVHYASKTLGLPVEAGDFLEYRSPEKIDVICLWDTIEHLQYPHLYLEKASVSLNPGGVIAITTGDIGSLVARLRGSKWRQIHPPTHLHYFSKATLTRLLGKFGFTVRYCGYEGMYRSLDTIAYIILNIKHQQPKLYAALKKTGMLSWDVYLNLRDIMFVIAELE